uniref:Uncharacterized protein n=1 Tax=Leptobrachium leishanense TaxID=445787 RepID=A0A8C5Q224_9ANUR
MASVDLRDELTCSICLNIYTFPVTLTCGHSFCRTCIGDVMDTQETRGYSCPECRDMFETKPDLKRNLRLNNIAETSLCDKHLKKHSKSEEHNRKCSVHNEILKYYCCKDAACICVSCRLDGEHRGHQVETLNEASEKKKETLRNILQKLTSQREEQEEQVSLRVSYLIRQLEIKKEELSRKMGDIKELCDMADPLTVLQGRESDRADYCEAEEDTERYDIMFHDFGDLDVGLISETLHSGLTGIVTRISRRHTASDMLLDVDTASNDVSVSEDLKTVSWSEINQSRPETQERFQDYSEVLSSSSFSSGRHYWEVEGSGSGRWIVGMAYNSIERKGEQSLIGNNKKSWGLWRNANNQYYVRHDNTQIRLPQTSSCHTLGIFLDYEAGRLSFYELCDPIRHLHTFTAAFTESTWYSCSTPDIFPDTGSRH